MTRLTDDELELAREVMESDPELHTIILELQSHRADLKAASETFLMDLPEPGSDLAKVMRTSRVLKTHMRRATAIAEDVLDCVEDIGPYPMIEKRLRKLMRELNG